jgi:murein DD-endopeptidase MepM/ murein hydrolase activator NlpD
VRPYAAPPVAAAPTPSTYVAPGYAARPPADATGQVASLTTPRYSPSYPAGGYAPSLGRERPTAQTPTVGAVSSAQIATAGRGRFIWPLRGQITSSFGDKPTGEHNDGMDIAALPGTSVKAAAAGEVVYAGSAIPGYGNLVLVKHAGGWVTAYAHLDRIEVRMRDSVSQGDEIGQAGATLAGARPGLHFEVRYAPSPTEKARPVDPTLVLPAG